MIDVVSPNLLNIVAIEEVFDKLPTRWDLAGLDRPILFIAEVSRSKR